jgi:hypothetical protein
VKDIFYGGGSCIPERKALGQRKALKVWIRKFKGLGYSGDIEVPAT